MSSTEADKPSRLILFSGSGPIKSKDTDCLVAALSGIGMIAGRIGNSSYDYFAGERFLDHVSFLGCSPNIAFSADESDQYCYVHFNDAKATPRIHSGMNTAPPKCSECGQVQNNWKQCVQVDYCGRCTLEDRQTLFKWRRKGALSRWVIEVMNIYPHEAIPSSLLLMSLAEVTGVEWHYAYLQA